jgi:hypothetical protein
MKQTVKGLFKNKYAIVLYINEFGLQFPESQQKMPPY